MKSKSIRTSSELFVAVTHEFIESSLFENMTPSTMKVYLLMLKMRYKGVGTCFPSMKTVCQKTQLSESTVQRALKELQEVELLDITPQYRADGSRTTNQYTPYMIHASDDKIAYIPNEDDDIATPPVFKYEVGGPTLNMKPLEEDNTIPEEDKKDVSVERDINKGKVKEIPPSPQRGGATASRGVNSSEQSILQEDEAPTQERISALKRAELDRELLAAFNTIHQIAGLSKPVTMNKVDKKLLSDAIKQGVTAERIGNAWKKALSNSDARYWPFHCVIEKLPTLEAEPPKQSKAKSRLSQDEIEAAAKKAWANAFGGALVCDKK